MMQVDREGVPMPDRFVTVGMAVRFRPLPAFMRVLVVLVVDMQVVVPKRFVLMLDLSPGSPAGQSRAARSVAPRLITARAAKVASRPSDAPSQPASG